MVKYGLHLIVAKTKLGKNTLPLLAITALLLSVALVNYDQSLVSNSNNTQSVLSESDERDEEDKEDIESREEEDKDDEDERDSQVKETPKPERKEKETVRSIKREETKKTKSETIRVEEEIEIEEEDSDSNDDQSNEDESIEDEDVETEFEEESETISADGTVNKFKLKIKTRTVAGKTVIETASGEVEVEKDPDEAINELVASGIIDEPVSFEAKVNNREKVEFEIQGTDSKRFLGIFKIVIPKLITVSSETGEVVSTNQNAWSRILSLLSI